MFSVESSMIKAHVLPHPVLLLLVEVVVAAARVPQVNNTSTTINWLEWPLIQELEVAVLVVRVVVQIRLTFTLTNTPFMLQMHQMHQMHPLSCPVCISFHIRSKTLETTINC